MDNSQNLFSSYSSNLSHNSSFMESESHEMLVLDIKEFLSKNTEVEEKKPTFLTQFTSILVNFQTYILQSLESIHKLLEDLQTDAAILLKYINNIIELLQLLTAFVKKINTIECSNMEMFPILTGDIIMLIFSHCKESGSLYGSFLYTIEKELKELFKSCHELQITYLLILEKRFILDLTNVSQKKVLIEALDLNLKISKVVQSLDVKTMAEQWKGITALCEKYSYHLMDKSIVYNSTKDLCALIEDNINTARQNNPDDRIIVRSLKVANFSIKILIKMCTIFKQSTEKDYKAIMELLLLIHLSKQDTGLGLKEDSSLSFKRLISSNVIDPSNVLLTELLSEENFVNCLLQYDIVNIKKDERLLGYILLLICTMKCILQKVSPMQSFKDKLISCLFKLLPHCHVWFSIDIQFKTDTDNKQAFGLYEHLLIHTVAFTQTLSLEEYTILEENMYNSLLGTDYCSAVFSLDLWLLLARTTKNLDLLYDQVSQLCKSYIQLEQKNVVFKYSLQQLHMKHAILRLFDLLPIKMRLSLYERVICKSDSLRILLLDEQLLKRNVEDEREIRRQLDNLDMYNVTSSRDIDKLIHTMNMIAKLQIENNERNIENSIEKLWMKLCPKSGGLDYLLNNVTLNNLWYLEFLKGLTSLTVSRISILQDNTIMMVFHVISSTIQNCNKEVKYTLMNPLCKLAAYSTNANNVHVVDTFKHLLNSDCRHTTDIVFFVLQKHMNGKLQNMISKLKKENHKINEAWNSYTQNLHSTNKYWKEQLCVTAECLLLHKCLKADEPMIVETAENGDFDLADMDSLFGDDNEEEPQTKKIKFSSEAYDVVKRLECDAELLLNNKEKVTVECKRRIRNVCDMLNKIN